jgi:hypothetical protein
MGAFHRWRSWESGGHGKVAVMGMHTLTSNPHVLQSTNFNRKSSTGQYSAVHYHHVHIQDQPNIMIKSIFIPTKSTNPENPIPRTFPHPDQNGLETFKCSLATLPMRDTPT